MSYFFVMPINCGKILYSKSNIESVNEIDSLWNKIFNKKIYNYFICTKGIAFYVMENGTVKGSIIFYDDKDFLKKLPKNPYDFYIKALEKFLKKAKKRLEKGESVNLYLKDYRFEISKNKFLVYKKEKLIVQNYFTDLAYTEMDEVVINPFTNKKIKFHAPKKVYDFFEFYYRIAKFKTNSKEVKRKNDFVILFYGILNVLVYLLGVFGFMFLFWYIDVLIFREFEPLRAIVEAIIAAALGEFVSDFFKSKFLY